MVKNLNNSLNAPNNVLLELLEQADEIETICVVLTKKNGDGQVWSNNITVKDLAWLQYILSSYLYVPFEGD
jgi:hypothetical protein